MSNSSDPSLLTEPMECATSADKDSLPITNKPRQRLDFDLFLSQLRSPPADPIIRYIRSFLNKFIASHHTFTTAEQARVVQNFKLFIFEKFQQYKPFYNMDEGQLWNSRFGMEKLIMTRLYPYVFSPELINNKTTINASHQEDLDVDSQLMANYITFQEILTPSDFEVDEKLIKLGGEFIKLSIQELRKINQFQAPRAKLICLLNGCKALIQLLKTLQSVSNADEFLPLLIYTVFQSQIPGMYCNLQYVERFAFELEGGNEVEYYLVCLSSAAEFIKNLHVEFADKLNADGSVTVNGQELTERLQQIDERPNDSDTKPYVLNNVEKDQEENLIDM